MPDSTTDYLALCNSAEVIEADGHGEKVLQLPDGSYLKVFRRKRLLSSAAWYPYARRFADNAAALARLGVPCPRVIHLHRFPIIRRDVVHYQPLPGLTLRQIIHGARPGIDTHALLGQLGRFVAALHCSGVFFRSIHLGNIVLGDDGRLGLIDIADMQIARRPLPRFKRKRNFAHLLRYREDRAWLMADGGIAFAEGYAAQAGKGYEAGDLQAWLNATDGAGR